MVGGTAFALVLITQRELSGLPVSDSGILARSPGLHPSTKVSTSWNSSLLLLTLSETQTHLLLQVDDRNSKYSPRLASRPAACAAMTKDTHATLEIEQVNSFEQIFNFRDVGAAVNEFLGKRWVKLEFYAKWSYSEL